MIEAPKGLVVWAENAADSAAEKLANRLGAPFVVSEEPPQADWLLFYDDEALHLYSAKHPEYRPFSVDYLGGEFGRRWQSATKNDILCKAAGIKKGVRTICDATGGLGYDAFFLSTFQGVEVTACERNPVATELFLDALSRVKDTGLSEKNPLYFHFGDGIEFLACHPEGFDAVYLDPMYPREDDKSAKQKKEMLLFRELVGKDEDAEALFQAAWKAAKKRVAVKRPDDAPAITKSREPDFIVPGKTVRFDIYLKPNA
jgi:16S rRNA (guanine1516-N2)-methyltransferase